MSTIVLCVTLTLIISMTCMASCHYFLRKRCPTKWNKKEIHLWNDCLKSMVKHWHIGARRRFPNPGGARMSATKHQQIAGERHQGPVVSVTLWKFWTVDTFRRRALVSSHFVVKRAFCAVLIHYRDDLFTTCNASWRTITPRDGFASFSTFSHAYGTRWRRSASRALVGARWRSMVAWFKLHITRNKYSTFVISSV